MASSLLSRSRFCSSASSLVRDHSISPHPSSSSAFIPLHGNAPLLRYARGNDRSLQLPWPQYRPNYSSLLMTRALNSTSIQTLETNNNEILGNSGDRDEWKVKMLYDGDCPLCLREVNMLRERNEKYGTIKFVDISSENYSAEENAGIDFAMAMGRIHAILHDGTVLYDIAAFKRLYEEVGLGWVYAFTKIKMIAVVADAVYAIWAKYRLPITGRPPLIQILQEREKKIKGECDSDRCRIE